MGHIRWRTTLGVVCVSVCLFGVVHAEVMSVLPKPPTKIQTDLFTALTARRSTESYAKTPLSRAKLSSLLWAANGINRKDGKRTAPSAFDSKSITIYCAEAGGVSRYDAAKHALQLVTTEDIRTKIAAQEFIGTAPCVLILVSDLSTFPVYAGKKNDRVIASHATAGFIGENVYLAAAALKLGTRYVMYIKPKDIQKALHLGKNEEAISVMPVGEFIK